jgi:shikimate dehydrogenase
MSERRAFVVGHPIAHSRSPLIHGHWLAELGIAGRYERVDVAPDAFPAFLRGLAERGYVGGNVTLPHKEAAFRAADRATEAAARLGAANTVWLGPGGEIVGHNTDGAGFLASLDAALGPTWDAEVATALVLGAGGAARAVAAALVERGLARVLVSNRTETRARDLIALAPDRMSVLPWADRALALGEVDLLVNATQLGMTGQGALDLPLDALGSRAMVSDLVYVPLETALLADARRRGLRVADGLGMLLHQAAPGFEAWFGVRPEVTPALRALVEADIGGRR